MIYTPIEEQDTRTYAFIVVDYLSTSVFFEIQRAVRSVHTDTPQPDGAFLAEKLPL
jgi:hypothetical protein